jgi:hypothetical protein
MQRIRSNNYSQPQNYCVRVDWGPSSVIFDDLLGLYYRPNRGIFGMSLKRLG